MSVWHQSCIEKICVDFSLNKPDFSSKKWSCPNCCKIWIIMSSWIDLRVVDHMVNKESIYYWLMCHEHFEYIWLTGDTVFTDFNPTLFSKIFLLYLHISKKFKIWVYQFFELFMWKLFFRWVIIFLKSCYGRENVMKISANTCR